MQKPIISLTSAVGTVIPLTSSTVAVSGVSASLSVNSVPPKLVPIITGQSLTTSVNSVSITLSPVIALTGELIPVIVNPLSVFTWSAVDDTTTGGNSWTDVSTTGSGGSSWTDVSTTGAGEIDPAQKVA